jgi:hypothetical protein
MMKSTLHQFQKNILAMSRAQYERMVSEFEHHEEYLNSTANAGRGQTETRSMGTDSFHRNVGAERDKDEIQKSLNVGVCVIRLDEETAEPAILLLRRSSPFMWQQHQDIFISTSETRQRVGDWELPGGMVQHDDFSISSAIDRLLRKQTGLRVIKIMEMLRDVGWIIDTKVLTWNEEDGFDGGGDRDGHEHNGNFEEGDRTGESSKSNIGYDDALSETVGSGGWSISGEEAQGSGEHTSDDASSYDEMFMRFLSDSIDIIGMRLPSSSYPSSLPRSSPAQSLLDIGTTSVHAGSQTPQSRYLDDDHHGIDSALRPAPLSLPLRPTNPKPTSNPLSVSRPRPEIMLTPDLVPQEHEEDRHHLERYTSTISSLSLPSPQSHSHLQPHPQARERRTPIRDRLEAQVIPYKMSRSQYMQLNVAVLVDEEVDEPVPSYLSAKEEPSSASTQVSGSGHDKIETNGNGTGDGDEEGRGFSDCQHNAFAWATLEQVRKMQMHDDLRCVVFQAFSWFDDLSGGYI